LTLGTPLFTTTFYALLELTGFTQLYTSLLLITASTMSVISLIKFQKEHRDLGLLLILPQQFLLLVSMGGAIEAVVKGVYADGTVRPSVFIFVDQFPAILIACFHTLAIFDIYSTKVHSLLNKVA
jgi:hypothetical protein